MKLYKSINYCLLKYVGVLKKRSFRFGILFRLFRLKPNHSRAIDTSHKEAVDATGNIVVVGKDAIIADIIAWLDAHVAMPQGGQA